MYVADDDESPRLARSAFSWRTALPVLLIALAGGYGALVVAARFSPSFAATVPWQSIGVSEGLKLPFLAQLASAFAGLAALVLVLARAVRAVDTHPYPAIAPVIAVFSGLVLAGLRVDLPFAGFSSPALVACAVLAVALIGGALVARDGLTPRVLGWVLVTAPCGLVLSAFSMGLGQTGDSSVLPGLDSPQRLFLALLCGSSLLLGLAGVVAQKVRARTERDDGVMHDAHGWAGAGSQPGLYPYRTDEGHAVPRWNRGGFGRPLQAAAVLLAVAGGAYFLVDRLKHGGEAAAVNTAPAWTSPAGAPVVEQLSATAPSKGSSVAATGGKRGQTAKPTVTRSAPSRPEPAPVAERRAPMQPKVEARGSSKAEHLAKRAEPTSRGAKRTSGLPAWGTESTAMRSFETAKPGKAAPTSKAASAPLAASSAPVSKPVAVPVASKAVEPVAASRPIAPPVSKPAPPAPPPAPAKPLTMDQLLDRVVESQPKKAGNSGPKSARDNEIDELLNAAVKPKSKGK